MSGLVESGGHVFARDHPALHQHFAQPVTGGLLLLQRIQELAGGDLLHADEDVAEAVAAAREGVQLLLEPRGRVGPELLLVGVAGRAEAVEAERAELGGVLGIVRAPDGAHGIEFAETVPARDVVGLDVAAPARVHALNSMP
jgi:hypothetical protein